MALSKLEIHKLVVIAIDFGTAFSGYAFAFNDEKKQIYMNKNWGARQGFQSYKTSTCVLLDENGDFKSFGYDAESEFVDNQDDYHLFRHFKMVLHREIEDRRKVTISLSISTIPVISLYILAIHLFTNSNVSRMI